MREERSRLGYSVSMLDKDPRFRVCGAGDFPPFLQLRSRICVCVYVYVWGQAGT